MNIQKLSLSALVIAGLSVGVTPTRLNAINPAYVGFCGGFLGLTLITLRLNAKKSVANPEEQYSWSDVSSNLLKGNFQEAAYALDERFIGQKAEPTSLKIVEGDDKVEIKGSGKTPATGVCGTAQAYLGQFAKATVDTGKVLAAPGLILALTGGLLKFTVKDNALLPVFKEDLFESFFFGKKNKTEAEKADERAKVAQESSKEYTQTIAIVQAAIDNGFIRLADAAQ